MSASIVDVKVAGRVRAGPEDDGSRHTAPRTSLYLLFSTLGRGPIQWRRGVEAVGTAKPRATREVHLSEIGVGVLAELEASQGSRSLSAKHRKGRDAVDLGGRAAFAGRATCYTVT